MLYQLSYEASPEAGEWNDVYMIDRMSALRIKNTSDNDPRSYEATKAVTKKALKKSKALTGAFYPLSLLSFICSA